ncbi:hypothetical protein KQX54_004839 [Cotesia glomerata]|uniref:Uncharacterized protein n=1 Tax=Cotesia glomerata TaxID=32391 RepID=A0AAV7HH54_COTGL|nr:hypothetical protein KQX54_004839 [Cotesia glomerata]
MSMWKCMYSSRGFDASSRITGSCIVLDGLPDVENKIWIWIWIWCKFIESSGMAQEKEVVCGEKSRGDMIALEARATDGSIISRACS